MECPLKGAGLVQIRSASGGFHPNKTLRIPGQLPKRLFKSHKDHEKGTHPLPVKAYCFFTFSR